MLTSEIKYYIQNSGDDNYGHRQEGDDMHVKGNSVSLSISCIMSILPILFLILAFVSWLRIKENLTIDENYKAREFYSGIRGVPKRYLYQRREQQNNQEVETSEKTSGFPQKIKLARLYYLLFLFKRFVIILTVVLMPNSMFSAKMPYLILLQTACIVYATCVRSFPRNKDQSIEALNEIVFLVLIILVTKYNSESKWTTTTSNIFIGVILSHLIILLIVSIISAITKIVKFINESKTREQITAYG